MSSGNESGPTKEPQGTATELSQERRDLDKIRSIINEKAFAEERARQSAKARANVSKVFTEALNDREQADGSVGKVVRPIVEQSMQTSMQLYQDRFTDYLYPLVGQLARKYTIQILRDFIEKTNEVIENTLSFKSLAWRFRAWRAGVSYRHFVASQTFVFQIKQILLIHKDTGLLLNSVSKDYKDEENSGLVSAMLTAINDFVSDSFTHSDPSNEQQLDEIKTDDFTLHILQGSKAVLVAAVEGTISPKVKYKLNSTLEQIHNIYMPQLTAFNGNTEGFITTREYLYDCLMSEQKDNTNKKKTPIFAIIGLLALVVLGAYWLVNHYITQQALNRLQALPQNQGILMTRASVEGWKDIQLDVLRDPRAMTLDQWINNSQVNPNWVTVRETPFISLAPTLIETEIRALLTEYPQLSYSTELKLISGSLNGNEYFAFQQAFEKIQGIDSANIASSIELVDANTQQKAASQAALTNIAGQISQLQVNFDLASADISPEEQKKLVRLVAQFKQLQTYAALNQMKAYLLILGTSDNLGNLQVNRQLSIERAMNTKRALINLGMNEEDMMVSGLGVVDVAQDSINVRKAIINIIYNPV